MVWLQLLLAGESGRTGEGRRKSRTRSGGLFDGLLPSQRVPLQWDQTDKGYSSFRYRPFTLEGNFAAAAGLQEMLLQSYSGTVRLFPAVPESWRDVSFKGLRAEGAFVVSAVRREGLIRSVEIAAEAGGPLRLENPFGEDGYSLSGASTGDVAIHGQELVLDMRPGQRVTFSRM